MMKRFAILLALGFVLLAAPVVQAADIVGRGSIGGSLGGMKFLSGDDFGEGEVRFIGQAVFKYNLSDHLAAVVESGWGWNAYPDNRPEKDTLATVIPTTFGLEYRSRLGQSNIWAHLGAGGGFYALGVKDSYRTWAHDGDTNAKLTWTSPGFYGKLGGEYLFDNAVSINVDFLYHAVFSNDEDRFPMRWGNQNTSFGEFRVGANYYFTLRDYGSGDGAEEE